VLLVVFLHFGNCVRILWIPGVQRDDGGLRRFK